MDTPMVEVGPHEQAELLDQKDVNGRFMVVCRRCGTHAHSFDKDQAAKDLAKTACDPFCYNCNSLRNSSGTQPAVPINGTCNDRLHVCPFEGNRWWQVNGYFHHWQQVTENREWEILTRNSSSRQLISK